MTLDVLFDYFRDSIEARRPEFIEALDHATQLVSVAAVDQGQKELAARLLKTICICEMIGDTRLAPTAEFLRLALNMPGETMPLVAEALHLLDTLDAVVAPPQDSGAYSLAVGGRIMPNRLKRLISEEEQKLPQDTAGHSVQSPGP